MPVNPSTNDFASFIAEAAARLGEDQVASDPPRIARYARSTAGPPTPPGGGEGPGGPVPGAVVYPRSTDEVQAIVRLAGECGIALHAISRGCNWGYGDARPPGAGQVIVDLSRMDQVLEANAELAYVRLQPGVSQGQLYDYLQSRNLPLWMDTTGAGPDASVVGNTLDRGFGHTRYGDHFLTACGMSVVLGDGRVLETSPRRVPGSRGHAVYRYGIGPFIDGLFSQSNFGIVTELTLWLMPKPEAFRAFFIVGKDDADLQPIVDKLAALRLRGLLQSTVHIGNDLRVLAARVRYPWDRTDGQTPLPDAVRQAMRREHGVGAWNVAGAIYGPKKHVAVTAGLLRRTMRPYRVAFVDDTRLKLAEGMAAALRRVGLGEKLTNLLDAVRGTYALLKGQPNHEPLRSVLWRVRGEVPHSPTDPLAVHAGLMWISPVLPQRGQTAGELVDLMSPIYEAHGFEPLITFTMINERAMICVSNIAFDTRQAAETASAKACYTALTDALLQAGFVPYRVGPSGYKAVADASPQTFNDLMGQLKAVFDPQGLLSPGRYLPQAGHHVEAAPNAHK